MSECYSDIRDALYVLTLHIVHYPQGFGMAPVGLYPAYPRRYFGVHRATMSKATSVVVSQEHINTFRLFLCPNRFRQHESYVAIRISVCCPHA